MQRRGESLKLGIVGSELADVVFSESVVVALRYATRATFETEDVLESQDMVEDEMFLTHVNIEVINYAEVPALQVGEVRRASRLAAESREILVSASNLVVFVLLYVEM